MDTFDYIIMGAGSAGCVLANRLTADPKISVLLIEAGGKDTNPWIHIPGGYFKTMHNPKTDWCFKIQSDPDTCFLYNYSSFIVCIFIRILLTGVKSFKVFQLLGNRIP